MNWNQVEGQWTQFRGQVKSKWAKLTDHDLENAAGKRDQLVGKLQEHYGILKEDAENQLDEWIAKLTPGKHDPPKKRD
ncbi:MAG: CsbD family protein [Myxococcales bacterium]|nr:CsbD family protein [Myxococcales bacterium]